MRQLAFTFIRELHAKCIIKFHNDAKEKLIKQMAVAIMKIYRKKEGGKRNDVGLSN